MTVGSLTPLQQATSSTQCLSIDDVRILVAKQLRVDIESVTGETHFTLDLGADFLVAQRSSIVSVRDVRGAISEH
jgi:hypothetical protein